MTFLPQNLRVSHLIQIHTVIPCHLLTPFPTDLPLRYLNDATLASLLFLKYTWGMFLPQGLWICCSFHLNCSSSRHTYGHIPHFLICSNKIISGKSILMSASFFSLLNTSLYLTCILLTLFIVFLTRMYVPQEWRFFSILFTTLCQHL